jgi:hypothetical protein
MKASILAFGLALGATVGNFSGAQAGVLVGDRHFEVLEILGQPNGCVGSEHFKVCYFDRGEVVFRNGVVESHTIVSVEELERRQAAAARQQEAREQRELERVQARIAEGLAILEEKVSDPHFASLPAINRFTFWQAFRQMYPEINVDLEYSVAYEEARREHAVQVAEMERERRLHELELRVREAEYQARRAEREAERARRERPVHIYQESFVHVQARPTVVIDPSVSWKERPSRKTAAPPVADTPPPPLAPRVTTLPPRPDIRDRLHPDAFMFPPLKDNF